MLEKTFSDNLSVFLKYLANIELNSGGRLPSLVVLSRQLGISVASLREQLEVARSMGLVEVRPKTGIRRLPYSFRPAVMQSLTYSIALDTSYFAEYSDLRIKLESAYWHQAVSLLCAEDHQALKKLVADAVEKLNGEPIHIPHTEHRQFHLLIYSRLENPFVSGLLEAYWDLYEAIGLNLYTNIQYLQRVWEYHQTIVEAISHGDFEAGYRALTEHIELLHLRQRKVQ